MEVQHESIPGPDVIISFSIQSKEGVDLLNPDNPLSFKHGDIGLYEDIQLTKEVTREWSSDIDGKMEIYKWEENGKEVYKISILAQGEKNLDDSKKYGSCYLKLSDEVIDEISVEIVDEMTYSYVSSFSYNGTVIFSDENGYVDWDGVIIK
ncbi:hypothetical protein [Flammeovirga sp. SubArs3]|uniref:hypothetical protein n=1 Tax=Flammeovirga sp. SubArs3 TaxID=2995316 RepID=UPI00248CC9E1|nr:hypothetical protein [Flammeovirga sp. SubArs3]